MGRRVVSRFMLLYLVGYSTLVKCSVDFKDHPAFQIQSRSNYTKCPPWTTRPRGNNSTCHCQFTENRAVQCTNNNMTVSLPLCYCMSYNELFNTTVVGYCIFRCHSNQSSDDHATTFRYTISSKMENVSQINQDLCSGLQMNRTGQMCGSCVKGYAPPVYSYSLACVHCSGYKYNWLKYIGVAYLPLTVFYVLVITFRISATSGAMNGFILTSQMLASPVIIRLLSNTHFKEQYVRVVMKILETLYGVWNLDFFRSLYTPFCIHPNVSKLQVLMLDYVVAVYPLLLIFITYVCVCLHFRYSIVVQLWRPFYRCFVYLRTEWDIRNSLIAAFATFILLSYVKILDTSLELLTPVTLFDMNGDTVSKQYLRVDGTIEYFGTHHFPYALLALVMVTVFNILPVILLCLYPSRCFHRCLNYCNVQRQTLNTFMEVIYGPFRILPRDCRYFAALYLIFRMGNLLNSIISSSVYLTYAGVLSIIATLIVAIGRPYRYPLYNVVDMICFTILTLSSYEYPCHIFQQIFSGNEYHVINMIWTIFYAVLLMVPAVYGTSILLYTILPRHQLAICFSNVSSKLKRLFKTSSPDAQSGDNEYPVPYRLEHSDEYPPLIDSLPNSTNYQAIRNVLN